VPGTYLVELVANGSVSYTSDVTGAHVPVGNQGGCGVKFRNDLRAPAGGETTQFGATGWNPALYGAILAVPRVLQVQDGDDITAPLTAAIAQATRAGGWGGRIHLPEGRFEISGTILFPQIAGMSIVGAGIRSTQLVWTGAAGIPMFEFNRCQDCGLSNFSVEVDAAAALRCVARFYNSTTPLTGTDVVPHQLSARDFIEHCLFELGGRADDGIQIVLEPTDPGDPPPVDGKNDQHRFTKVHIRDYTKAAVVIEGQASLDNRFEGCIFQGGGFGKVGIDTKRNPRGAGSGSFSMDGGVIMDHTEADFDLTRSNGPITITGVWSERSARLMRVADYSADDPAQVERFAVAIDGMRWSSSSGEIAADGEIIQFTASGPLDVNALTVGTQTQTLPYRIRFQPRLEQGGYFSCNGVVSTTDRGALFTGRLPDSYGGYRHLGSNQYGPLISTVDGGRQKPVTEADWLRVVGIVPRCWYRFGETLGSGASMDTGAVFDCNTRLPRINLVPSASPRYRQARPGFDEQWAEFVSGTVDQQFKLNNTTEINPQDDSVAFLIHFGAVTLTAADEYLCVLGAGSAGAGGGPLVWFTAAGRMRGTIDGVTTNGTFDYRAAGDYLLVAGYDRSVGGAFTLRTDKDLIAVSTPSTNVGNNATKGLGTGSSAGTLKTAGYQVGLFAVFTGTDAEALIAMGSQVQRRMGW